MRKIITVAKWQAIRKTQDDKDENKRAFDPLGQVTYPYLLGLGLGLGLGLEFELELGLELGFDPLG